MTDQELYAAMSALDPNWNQYGASRERAARLARGVVEAALSTKQERISELEAQNAQLLESLRHMVTFFERFEDTHTVLAMDEARATIAAVEGKYDR